MTAEAWSRRRLLARAAQWGGGLALAPAVAPLQAQPAYELRHERIWPLRAERGMVVSAHALATAAGADVLRERGNAVDAAVAVGFTLAVVLPFAGNLGGGGFALVHAGHTGRVHAFDFRETAPAAATRDMFVDARGEVLRGRSLSSHLAVGVPGTVAGLAHLHRQFGRLPFARLLEPAIQHAREGFVVGPTLAMLLAADARRLRRWPATREIFLPHGTPPVVGERLLQRDLADSLQRIARDGPRAFYEGELAGRIADEMARHQGLVTRDDLRSYRALEREPVAGDYRGYRVVSMPPPSSGGVHLIQMLGLLQAWPLASYGHNSAQTIHLLAEVMKRAYADRAEHLGDPDFVHVPVRGLLSARYLRTLGAGIDPLRATPADTIRPGRPQDHESDQTTHYSVADRDGNLVSTTYTLNLSFGSGIVAAGTGILLNNEMDDFAVKAGVPNAFGLTGGDANAVAPMKRPLSSMTPTIVLRDGRPWLATGSPGGSRIITTVLQTIVNMVDFGMNAAEAGLAARVHHQWQPDDLRVERGISVDTLALLRARGHSISERPAMGSTQTIVIDEKGFAGWSDSRSPEGAAAGP